VRILFDQGVPVPLRIGLGAHEVQTTHERGWALMKNGELLAASESEGFDVFVTTDQNLKYQQNLKDRRMAIVVLLTTSWPKIEKVLATVVMAIEGGKAGDYIEVPVQ
jgi:hypothetical protein